MKIVCCIDDEQSVPNAVRAMVEQRSDPGVHFFHLRAGNADQQQGKPTTDEPVDVPAEVEKGSDVAEFLSAVAIAKTIEALARNGHSVLFVCDQRLENVPWPVDWDNALDFDKEMLNSKEKKQIDALHTRPGIYLLHKIGRHGFNYVLSSKNVARPRLIDIDVRQPLDSSDGTPDDVAKMVEKWYTREFGINSMWYDLVQSEPDALGDLCDRLGREPFSTDKRHDIENIVRGPNAVDRETITSCRTLLKDLLAVDEDIEDARQKLQRHDSGSNVLGVAKTVAVLRRIQFKTYLFDLLDILRRKPQHTVEVNGDEVKNMSDLELVVHSKLTLPLSSGMAKLSEFFKDAPDSEFSWHHRVRVGNWLEESNGNHVQAVYEVVVTPSSGKNHSLNLSKLQREGPGNGSRAFRTMSYLFERLDLNLAVVQEDSAREISMMSGQGLFILVKRTGENYEIRLFGRREFGVVGA